jgi:general stress protein CsbA
MMREYEHYIAEILARQLASAGVLHSYTEHVCSAAPDCTLGVGASVDASEFPEDACVVVVGASPIRPVYATIVLTEGITAASETKDLLRECGIDIHTVDTTAQS